MVSERSCVKLEFIVVGGGLSGLASAFLLRRAGHEVTVLEKGGGSKSIGAMCSPPNVTKFLQDFVDSATLNRTFSKCREIRFFSPLSEESLGSMSFESEDAGPRPPGDAVYGWLEHKDLESIVRNLALDIGVTVKMHSEVISANPTTGTVFLASAEVLSADVIIAADGHDSFIRPLVTGVEDKGDEPTSGHLVLSLEVPSATLGEHEDLQVFLDPGVWNLWLGKGYIAHVEMLKSNETCSVIVAKLLQPMIIAPSHQNWSTGLVPKQYGLDDAPFGVKLRKLIDLSTNVKWRAYRLRVTSEAFVSENSRVVLVGDAAHPMVPTGYYTPALAIEDAQTLGALFSKIQDKDDIPRFLTAYDDIRSPRLALTAQYSHQWLMQSADKDLTQLTDEEFGEQWSREAAVTSHDAIEKVEEWWNQMGSMMMRQSPKRDPVNVAVEMISARQD